MSLEMDDENSGRLKIRTSINFRALEGQNYIFGMGFSGSDLQYIKGSDLYTCLGI